MRKIQLLILGYSSFVKRRVLPAIKKIQKIEYFICSKSNKINLKEKILFNNYNQALTKTKPDIVYISLINSLHFKYAKKALEKGLNVIVDKPITTSLQETKILLKLAQKKKLLISEAMLYNHHNVFNKIIKLCNGVNNISHIQSNFNIPLIKNSNEITKIKGDCEMDMGPYAASIIRLFSDKTITELKVFKEYFKTNKKAVKSFFVLAKLKNCTYFGNFGFDKTYISNIIFFTKNKIISSPNRIFALPPNKDVSILVKEKKTIKKMNIKKDDCILNYFKKILYAIEYKKNENFYKNILSDAIIREKINLT